jgi:hypothetical protein
VSRTDGTPRHYVRPHATVWRLHRPGSRVPWRHFEMKPNADLKDGSRQFKPSRWDPSRKVGGCVSRVAKHYVGHFRP